MLLRFSSFERFLNIHWKWGTLNAHIYVLLLKISWSRAKYLSDAAISIFRRSFRISSLLVFCKIAAQQNFTKILSTSLYRTLLDNSFWYLENLTFKLLKLNKFARSINIVSKLYNSLKSDIYFNPIFIPWFSRPRIFSV